MRLGYHRLRRKQLQLHSGKNANGLGMLWFLPTRGRQKNRTQGRSTRIHCLFNSIPAYDTTLRRSSIARLNASESHEAGKMHLFHAHCIVAT
jgi:hypothetical protein